MQTAQSLAIDLMPSHIVGAAENFSTNRCEVDRSGESGDDSLPMFNPLLMHPAAGKANETHTEHQLEITSIARPRRLPVLQKFRSKMASP